MSHTNIPQEFESNTPDSGSDTTLTDQISIRPFEMEDQDGVFRVLRNANYHNLLLAFRMNVTGTPFQIFTVLVAALSLYTLRSIVCTLLAVASCFGLVMVLHLVGSLYYLYGSPLEDVRNVKNVYFEDADCHFWVAEAVSTTEPNRQIVGTIAIVRRYERPGKVAWLRRMAVLNEFRRKGIAKRLIVTTLKFCKSREYTVVELRTTSIHQNARNLYMRLGFVCHDYRPYTYMQGLVQIHIYEFQFKLDKIEDTGLTVTSPPAYTVSY